jgi:hypothetical protein
MDNEDTRKDIIQFLNHIKDTAHELIAWMEKQEHVFDIAIIHSGICLQGIHTSNLYKCVGKNKAEKPFREIMDDFLNDRGVLNEGLSMILDDVAVLIRLID